MTPSNPQEQLEQFPADWAWIDRLTALAFGLPHVQERPTQIAPDGSRALTLPPEWARGPTQAFLVQTEFAHIHNSPIGSLHMTLPEPVRELAVSRRWALRHPFSVRGWGTPDAVFVFAPRDGGEWQWVAALLRASHAYALGELGSK